MINFFGHFKAASGSFLCLQRKELLGRRVRTVCKDTG